MSSDLGAVESPCSRGCAGPGRGGSRSVKIKSLGHCEHGSDDAKSRSDDYGCPRLTLRLSLEKVQDHLCGPLFETVSPDHAFHCMA